MEVMLMNLSDILQCPICGSNVNIYNGKVLCDKCGFETSEMIVKNKINEKPYIINKPFSFALEITKGNAINRSFMNVCIKSFAKNISGIVLDIGSGKNATYHRYFNNVGLNLTKVDGNILNNPDILANIEEKLPLRDKSIDSVLLFNVLEHIYDYNFTLSEINRILKDNGVFYLYVPYFIKIHSSPLDYFRYTHHSLKKMFNDKGFKDIKIYTNGGMFKYVSELLNWLSLLGIGYLLFPIYFILCLIDLILVKLTNNKFAIDFPIGYFIICRK